MVNMAVSYPLHIFPRKPQLFGLTLDDKRAPLTRPGIYPQNFSIIYTTLNCKGFWKTTKEWVGLFEFHKRRNFFSLIKKYVLLGVINLPCPFQKRPSYFLHFCQVENIHGTYLKQLSDLFKSPIPAGRVEKRWWVLC